MITYYFNIRFYGTVNTRSLTISFLDQNSTAAASNSFTVDVSKEVAAFSDTDSDCLGCKYSQTIVSGSIILSQGGYDTVVNITDASGQFQVI
jgi:hypothetical protein